MNEYRALTVFNRIPAGCILQPVVNDESDPHLRVGEFAVIDKDDTEPQNGEVYLIRWADGATAIVQAFCRQGYNEQLGDYTGWWTRSLRSMSYTQELAKARRASPAGSVVTVPRGCIVDGPRLRETFRSALIGRVIGIYQSGVDAPCLAPPFGGG